MYLRIENNFFRRFGIRSRLVFFFLLAFGSLFALFSAGMYIYISKVHREEFDAALYNYVVDVSHSLDADSLFDRLSPNEIPSDTEMILPFSLGETLLQVSDRFGNVMLRSTNLGGSSLPAPHHSYHRLLAEHSLFRDVHLNRSSRSEDASSRYRMVAHAFEKNGRDYIIQAAVPMILLDRQQEGLLLFLALTVPLTLLSGSFPTLVHSRFSLYFGYWGVPPQYPR